MSARMHVLKRVFFFTSSLFAVAADLKADEGQEITETTHVTFNTLAVSTTCAAWSNSRLQL